MNDPRSQPASARAVREDADAEQTTQIVRATWRDTRALVKLDRRCFKPIDAFGWYEFFGLSVWPGVIALKAMNGDRIVGFIAGDPRRSEGHTIIVTIGVDPDWQGRGLGERLMRAVEARSVLPRLQLMVRVSNRPALGLYRKLGYQIVDTWRRYYGDGEDAYLMEKDISPLPQSSP
ncbi:MAG: GNAT family N-acetyltransferase [Anaerolineae bacterium]